MGDSNRTGLAYIEETVWGTVPAKALTGLRFTGESLAFNVANTKKLARTQINYS